MDSADKLRQARVHLIWAQVKYKDDRFSEALNDLNEVDDTLDNSNVLAHKHLNMGLCQYKLGDYKNAESKYFEAMKLNPNLIEAYYNLGVLYNAEGKRDICKRFFDACLKIKVSFPEAWQALVKIEAVGQLDWYDWWFAAKSSKKIIRGRKFFGGGLIGAIAILIFITVYASFNNIETNGLIVIVGILVGMLLLPSLRKVKVGEIEFEIQDMGVGFIDLEPLVAPLPIDERLL
jgi:tetratricopeptide (TPR) repeat protein